MKWEPWVTFNSPIDTIIYEHIEPPCLQCAYWRPQRLYSSNEGTPIFIGVRFCHTPSMEHDFSCYIESK